MRDDELLSEVKYGNRQAFKEIVMRYLPVVSRTSYRIMCDRTDSEDITKSVFLSLWRKPGHFEGHVFEELLSMTCRQSRIRLLRRSIFSIIYINQEVFIFSAQIFPSEDEYVARKVWEVFCRASDNCSGIQRVAYALCEMEGLSRDVASSVGKIIPSHLDEALELAREKVRQELDCYGRIEDYDSYVAFLRRVKDQLTDCVRLQVKIMDALRH